MSVRIVFYAPPGKVFPCSSLVRGHVEVHIKDASQASSIDRLNLKFYGRAKAVIADGTTKNTTYYNSKALLFSHHYTLTDPPTFTIAPSRRGEDGGTLSFQFEIRVPT